MGLEDFLKIDASKAGEDAGRCYSSEADEAISGAAGVRGGGELGDGDAGGEDNESEPFLGSDSLAEQSHGKDGGCEDLALVSNLESGGIQV